MPFLKILLYCPLGLAIAATSLLLSAPAGQAAEEVVFRYGILRQRLAVSELSDFAERGEVSPVMGRYLEKTNSDPKSVRQILMQPVDVNSKLLDKALNNSVGNLLLDEMGKMIQTPDDRENREALRTALIQSTSSDNKLTLLEVIQNYPTDEIHLDVKRALRTYRQVERYQKPAQGALEKIEPLRQILKDQKIKLPDFLK
ncbi:MAG: alpha/beta hydrolase [Leptolyngbyaceae cyanobacterium RU_5_1]|nr:alpha/beta hydrolase [Leptolyngbyaceae cyanobacterium RU_5_1]